MPYGRVVEQAKSVAERRELGKVVEGLSGPMDDSVDKEVYHAILREAVERRNGWKVILQACS